MQENERPVGIGGNEGAAYTRFFGRDERVLLIIVVSAFSKRAIDYYMSMSMSKTLVVADVFGGASDQAKSAPPTFHLQPQKR